MRCPRIIVSGLSGLPFRPEGLDTSGKSMFEPRNEQHRAIRPSRPTTTAENPSPGQRNRIRGTLSLDSFWTAVDAPVPERPGG